MSAATDPPPVATPAQAVAGTRYYDLVLGAFVCVLLCSNLIGVKKVTAVELPVVGLLVFGAGNLFFPISYLFGDVLTEVYGYARARRVVWTGFAALAFASFQSFVVVSLPAADSFVDQDKLEWAFGSTWRIAGASLLARLKVLTRGRLLPLRTISSTVVGEAIDSILFYPLAFYGVWSNELLLKVLIANYALKVLWEVLATPLTVRVVNWLKRKEGVDIYDTHTDFTPFSLKV
jgi:uncharacterized integral membrane protein (TIGR00697 family)